MTCSLSHKTAIAFCRRMLMLLLPAAVALVPTLKADIDVFNNVTAACSCGFQINGSSLRFPESFAAAFTPSGNYDMTGAAAQLVDETNGQVNVIDFALYSNSSGLPGTLLGSLGSATISGASLYSAGGPIPSGLLLSSGVEYWLVLTPGTSQTNVAWGTNGSSSVPESFTTDPTGASGWTKFGSGSLQFEITGTQVGTVPEPTSIALLGGVLLFTGSRLRKRFRRR